MSFQITVSIVKFVAKERVSPCKQTTTTVEVVIAGARPRRLAAILRAGIYSRTTIIVAVVEMYARISTARAAEERAFA